MSSKKTSQIEPVQIDFKIQDKTGSDEKLTIIPFFFIQTRWMKHYATKHISIGIIWFFDSRLEERCLELWQKAFKLCQKISEWDGLLQTKRLIKMLRFKLLKIFQPILLNCIVMIELKAARFTKFPVNFGSRDRKIILSLKLHSNRGYIITISKHLFQFS